MPFFKISSVPTDSHTETNCVYVSPADAASVGKFVDVRGFPFSVLTDERVVAGTLAMNGIQRRCAGVTVTTGDGVDVPLGGLRPPTDSLIAEIDLEVEYVAASKRGGQLDYKQFVDFLTHNFTGQYFKEGQMFAALLDSSSKFTVKITSMMSSSKSGALIAQLVSETKFTIRATEKSEISLVNLPDEQVDKAAPSIIQKNFNLEALGIGGLKKEFGDVFRRAFASRIFPPSFVKKLNLPHAKGVLLYGPPGTGKTLIARKIGEILNSRPPKIVNGPEVFNKFVGGTEENVRKLFADAEAEQASKGDQSQLHLIIFDEFDAICKQRGATRDGTGVNDNVVNQLLSKIDGVNSLNNVLLIGMTNRKDLIDEAILRPGRFEVHVEIGLPDEEGRLEIFRIHTKGMREAGTMGSDVSLDELAKMCKNYSGAEIAGVVRAATANGMNRHIDMDHITETIAAADIKFTHSDFMKAVKEVPPAFGQAVDECANAIRMGIIPYGPIWTTIEQKCKTFVSHLRNSKRLDSLSILVDGHVGSGKSAIAAHLSMLAEFPYVKFLSSDNMVGYGEAQKANIIRKAFDDAYKSTQSVVILDDLERLIEYSQLGGRYSNMILQTLLVLIKKPPPEGKRLMVIGTTSQYDVVDSLELAHMFSVNLKVPTLDADALPLVAKGSKYRFSDPQTEQNCVSMMPRQVTIKKLLLLLEMAAGPDGVISYESFTEGLISMGL